jgi:N-acetylglucosamine-6-phosphate deacetylase
MDFPRFPDPPLAIVHGRVILPRQVIAGKAVLIAKGKILGIQPEENLSPEITRFDAGGRYVSPGLVDIHTHGALGRSFNEPLEEAWQVITAANAQRGVTSLLATLAVAPIEELIECLALARRWRMNPSAGAQVLGVHAEGPYINPAQAGAQNPKNIRSPDDGTAGQILEYADVLTMMTYAPELPGAIALTDRLIELGIVPAAGHSAARDADVLAAMEHGLRHTVHIWSSQSSVVREGPWRKAGLLEASLAFDALSAEVIADNRHLPPTLMRLAYKCKGPDRLCAVSDATLAAGWPDGTRFEFCGLECEVRSGVAMLLDRTSFAGSTTLLNQMIPILTHEVGMPLAEAVRMASLTPARVIGQDQTKGSLAAGKDADLVIFDDDFQAVGTMIAGRWVYPGPAISEGVEAGGHG